MVGTFRPEARGCERGSDSVTPDGTLAGMRDLAAGAIVAGVVIGWFVTHSHRDWTDYRASVLRMKGNRSLFWHRLPRALIAAAVGFAVLRTLL